MSARTPMPADLVGPRIFCEAAPPEARPRRMAELDLGCRALILVWPDGRLRVSSEHGTTWGEADGLESALDRAGLVAAEEHGLEAGGRVQRVTFWPWEVIPCA